EDRIAVNSNGRNAANPASTRPEQITRTRLGTGSMDTASPRLITVIRSAPPRSSSALAARTAAGPALRTTGSRYDSAPNSTWAANPAASAGVSQPNRPPAVTQSPAVNSTTADATRHTASQSTAANTENVAYVDGGLLTAASANGLAINANPARYPTRPAP